MKLYPKSVTKYLKHDFCIVETYNCVDSTNLMMKKRGREGAPHGLIIVAESQTAGRGRMGRDFFSPAETGIYFSILLRPKLSPADCQLITTAAAVACARVLEKFANSPAKIKWVNDIYINDRKVCGILTEAAIAANGTLNYAVLGIGINITPPTNHFPDEIAEKAGSVVLSVDEDLRGEITAQILNEFFDIYNQIEERTYFNEYRSRSYLDGVSVEVLKHDASIPAKALYIDENLCLVVQYSSGSTERLFTGDVSIKKI